MSSQHARYTFVLLVHAIIKNKKIQGYASVNYRTNIYMNTLVYCIVNYVVACYNVSTYLSHSAHPPSK